MGSEVKDLGPALYDAGQKGRLVGEATAPDASFGAHSPRQPTHEDIGTSLGEVKKDEPSPSPPFGVDAIALKQKWRESTPWHDLDAMLAAAPANQATLAAAAREIATSTGSDFRNPGVKAVSLRELAAIDDPALRVKKQAGYDRFLAKVGSGSPGRVTDLVRGGFEVVTPHQAEAIVDALARRFDLLDEGWARPLRDTSTASSTFASRTA